MKFWRGKDGIWRVRDTIPCLPAQCDACKAGKSHKKHSRRFQKSLGKVKGEAEALALEVVQKEKDRGRGVEPIPTLGKAVLRWLASHKVGTNRDNSEVSWGHWRNIEEFGRCYLYGMEDMPMDRITNEVVQLARGRHLNGRTGASADLWLRNLNLVGNWAVGAKLVPARPWKVKFIDPPKARRPTLPMSMVAAYVNAALEVSYVTKRWKAEGAEVRYARNEQVKTALYLMFGLLLREGEVLGFRWEWLDLENETYWPGFAKGKDLKPVPMPQWLVAFLKVLKGDQPRLGLIIPNDDGGRHGPGFTRKAMAAANRKLGVKGISPHRIRGTLMTQLFRQGAPPKEVQTIGRHEELETTMIYYEEDLEIARRHMNELGDTMGLA